MRRRLGRLPVGARATNLIIRLAARLAVVWSPLSHNHLTAERRATVFGGQPGRGVAGTLLMGFLEQRWPIPPAS